LPPSKKCRQSLGLVGDLINVMGFNEAPSTICTRRNKGLQMCMLRRDTTKVVGGNRTALSTDRLQKEKPCIYVYFCRAKRAGIKENSYMEKVLLKPVRAGPKCDSIAGVYVPRCGIQELSLKRSNKKRLLCPGPFCVYAMRVHPAHRNQPPFLPVSGAYRPPDPYSSLRPSSACTFHLRQSRISCSVSMSRDWTQALKLGSSRAEEHARSEVRMAFVWLLIVRRACGSW